MTIMLPLQTPSGKTGKEFRSMDARRRLRNLAKSLLGVSLLATSTGCNPLGWGINQVQHLIHHHAQRPVMRNGDDWPAPAGPKSLQPGKTAAQPA